MPGALRKVRVPTHRKYNNEKDWRGRVTIGGTTYSTGKWGTPEARERYDWLVGEWLKGTLTEKKAGERRAADVAAGQAIPRLREHASGRARVTINGKDLYLGEYGTPEAEAEYKRLVAEWLASGRVVGPTEGQDENRTMVEIITLYVQHANQKFATCNSERVAIISTMKVVCELYGNVPVKTFKGKAMNVTRQEMVRRGWARKTINHRMNRIKRMFKWSVNQELIPGACYQDVRDFEGLRKGEGGRETPKIRPVDIDVYTATKPHLSPVVAAMIEVEIVCGMRPEEVTIMRPIDIKRDGQVWEYRPQWHKTERHDVDRVIYLGPLAQHVIKPYLENRPDNSYLFTPRESWEWHVANKRAERKTKLYPSHLREIEKKRKGTRRFNDRYTTEAYRQAIHHACQRAFPHPELSAVPKTKLTPTQRKELDAWVKAHHWNPNQLRHYAATVIRKRFGLEGASVILGHTNLKTTEIYAEQDHERAKEIALAMS